MKLRILFALATVVAVALVVAGDPWTAGARDGERPWAAPELPHQNEQDWINSRPLKMADLQGRVVLVDFWTFGCWNCYRSFPWLKGLENRYGDRGLIVIGVHTPEFEHEKDRQRIAAKVREFGLEHPVMIDNDFSYWKAMSNRYWPTFYLIDKAGQVRAAYSGEMHSGDQPARALEAQIRQLLDESA
jgi:thiol-disulfide isomerase/thioredoxin